MTAATNRSPTWARHRGRRAFLLAVPLAIAASGCGGASPPDAESPALVVFAAASLGDVIEEAAADFGRERGVGLTYNLGGSGALARQLLAAPRADLFISADPHWMDELARADLLEPGTRRTLLTNRLVVIGHAEYREAVSAPVDLCQARFELLSIGDPAFVPAGRYARDWLASIACPDGASLWERLQDRIAPAPDVRAALTQVVGSVDVLGIVYRTDVVVRDADVTVLYEVPQDDGPKVTYPAAVITTTGTPDLAEALLEYLGGPGARSVFEAHGFGVPEADGTGSRVR